MKRRNKRYLMIFLVSFFIFNGLCKATDLNFSESDKKKSAVGLYFIFLDYPLFSGMYNISPKIDIELQLGLFKEKRILLKGIYRFSKKKRIDMYAFLMGGLFQLIQTLDSGFSYKDNAFMISTGMGLEWYLAKMFGEKSSLSLQFDLGLGLGLGREKGFEVFPVIAVGSYLRI